MSTYLETHALPNNKKITRYTLLQEKYDGLLLVKHIIGKHGALSFKFNEVHDSV
jgi:hypothetical protein